MPIPFDLAQLGPSEFENIVNFLALKTLGLGQTGFGPGSDGGRDGYFQGEAPYPSITNQWAGVWYIQSKFHAPHLTTNSQKWLVDQVAREIELFDRDPSDRRWPDNWIIATNVDQSGRPQTGSFDAIRKLIKNSKAPKGVNVDVWGGRKILDLLALHGDVARYYGHFLTPGHLITKLYDELNDERASISELTRFFLVSQFTDNLFTKLDQAGSSADIRPGVHDLFIDLPCKVDSVPQDVEVLLSLTAAAANCHKYSLRKQYPNSWDRWNNSPKRARVSLIKGGPGQGKSTVGQYLCQIHRAFFVLASDGPPVLDGVRTSALAIIAAARRDGFIPISPRIPIQVELKDFAHWFSQRTLGQPRTVLAYVAELVSRRIGFAASPKTIKRALGHGAWLAVFDGLDEVPNDFKDAVASEVLTFLNDLLVEIDADVLSLCTSRPQGYSGQFAGIEGPVIELSLLDRDAAMKCARPVLSFGRAPDEAEKSIDTLGKAIESPNVRELMTTPLQAHIMAVVVRDGGRPPERRWQLFNSFYFVMKKRESLKDFQDKRISKLLREEDRLLKSVHMRLGFVLHARAERSEGAQTNLSKEEFRQLVRDAVTQLVDRDIDDTVAGVMEATTERLVLVSTPESGSHVRFDIRQLQEFFAAEFLYDGVDPVETAARIETIAGDAHWREVIHFLLSALIENRRTADIAIAVQVLRKLNEGEEGGARLFHRRMARAGLLAGRLLVEGVLEQDQRDRQHLKPLLDPLSGIFDIGSLRGLARLGPTRSRQWLSELLVDKVATAVPRESVGALYLLGWLLEDGSPAAKPAEVAFLNLSRGFQANLIAHWQPSDEIDFQRGISVKGKSSEPLSQWVTTLAVRLLASDSWIEHSGDTIRDLVNICRHSGLENLKIALSIAGYSDQLRGCLLASIEMYNEVHQRKTHSKSNVVDCGILRGHLYEHTWQTKTIPKLLRPFDAGRLILGVAGFFRLMMNCVWWCQSRSDGALLELVSSVRNAGSRRVSALPPALLALTPLNGAQAIDAYSVTHLEGVDAIGVEALAANLNECGLSLIYADMSITFHKESSQERWRRLAQTMPAFAISIALSPDKIRWVEKAELVPEIIQLIQDHPENVARCILGWGVLKENNPELLARVKAKVAALPAGLWDFVDLSPLRDVDPFELALPDDAKLLPVLAPALVELFTGSYSTNFRRQLSESTLSSPESLLALYGLSAATLQQIVHSNANSTEVQAGAAALFWLLLPEVRAKSGGMPSGTTLSGELAVYKSLRNLINEEWLTRSLTHGVLMACSETDSEAIRAVTYLMELCLDGEGPQEVLVELITSWRERSIAPVNGKQALERWLGYHFEPPTYASG